MTKPHIKRVKVHRGGFGMGRRKHSAYKCSGDATSGYGKTMPEAYERWEFYRKMEEQLPTPWHLSLHNNRHEQTH